MKYRLLSPGPTPVPERVLTAMANPIPHHRTPAFEATFAACREGLQWLFQTKQEVLTLSCSGTGAFEAAYQSLLSPGDVVITVAAGKFGERWGNMAKAFGFQPVINAVGYATRVSGSCPHPEVVAAMAEIRISGAVPAWLALLWCSASQ